MIINYSEIKKINFLDYEIDDEKNLNIINCFDQIVKEIQNNKLECIITGGLASVLNHKKIYRTIRDIDLIINFKEVKKWFEIFKFLFANNYEFITWEEKYHKDPYLMFKDFLEQKASTISFKSPKYECMIEFINCLNNFNFYKEQSFLKEKYVYVLPTNLNLNHKLTIINREKDAHDLKFANKYLLLTNN